MTDYIKGPSGPYDIQFSEEIDLHGIIIPATSQKTILFNNWNELSTSVKIQITL